MYWISVTVNGKTSGFEVTPGEAFTIPSWVKADNGFTVFGRAYKSNWQLLEVTATVEG